MKIVKVARDLEGEVNRKQKTNETSGYISEGQGYLIKLTANIIPYSNPLTYRHLVYNFNAWKHRKKFLKKILPSQKFIQVRREKLKIRWNTYHSWLPCICGILNVWIQPTKKYSGEKCTYTKHTLTLFFVIFTKKCNITIFKLFVF